MCRVKQILNYSVPVPVIAPQFVEDNSVLSKRHLVLVVGNVLGDPNPKGTVPAPGTWRISPLVDMVWWREK